MLIHTLKRVIRPTRGFQTMKTASATLTGFEVMRMIRRGHCNPAGTSSDRRSPLRQSALRSCCLNGPLNWVRYAVFKLLQRCRRERPLHFICQGSWIGSVPRPLTRLWISIDFGPLSTFVRLPTSSCDAGPDHTKSTSLK
jgi:hypothetical protein